MLLRRGLSTLRSWRASRRTWRGSACPPSAAQWGERAKVPVASAEAALPTTSGLPSCRGEHEGVLGSRCWHSTAGTGRWGSPWKGARQGLPEPRRGPARPGSLHPGSPRAFNQSAAIAEGLSRECGIPAREGRSDERRAERPRRREAHSHAAGCPQPRKGALAGMRVVLVDDVHHRDYRSGG